MFETIKSWWIVLQSGNNSTVDCGGELINNICHGQLEQAVYQPFTDLLGPVFPVLVIFGFLGPTYIYADDPTLPVVLMILLGGVMWQGLPGAARTVAFFFMLVGIAGAGWLAYTRGANQKR